MVYDHHLFLEGRRINRRRIRTLWMQRGRLHPNVLDLMSVSVFCFLLFASPWITSGSRGALIEYPMSKICLTPSGVNIHILRPIYQLPIPHGPFVPHVTTLAPLGPSGCHSKF